MQQLLSAFFQSLMPEALKTMGAEALGGEAVAAAAPQAMASAAPQAAAPMTVGQAVGNFAGQSINNQVQPMMDFYNQVTAPNATAGDMARSAFQYSIKTDKDPDNQLRTPGLAPMNPYANMTNNTVGGIPSLLQNTQSGLLPFFGSR
jgi:hypothetical protein